MSLLLLLLLLVVVVLVLVLLFVPVLQIHLEHCSRQRLQHTLHQELSGSSSSGSSSDIVGGISGFGD